MSKEGVSVRVLLSITSDRAGYAKIFVQGAWAATLSAGKDWTFGSETGQSDWSPAVGYCALTQICCSVPGGTGPAGMLRTQFSVILPVEHREGALKAEQLLGLTRRDS